MRKSAAVLCLMALLAVLLAVPAGAAGEASVLAGFGQGGHLYTFVQLSGTEQEGLSARLQPEGSARQVDASLGPQALSQRPVPVSYLLLIDRSASMGLRGHLVESFLSALLQADETAALFSLATFGEGFRVEQADTSDPSALQAAVRGIDYDAGQTNLAQGVLDALNYLERRSRSAGELVNLVVITDGIPDNAWERPTLEEAVQRVEGATGVLTHTFGIAAASREESPQALEGLSALGLGAHTVLEQGGQNPQPQAAAIAEVVNGLSALRFDLTETPGGDTLGGQIYFFQGEEGERQLLFSTQVPALPLLGESSPQGGAPTPTPVQPTPSATAEPSASPQPDQTPAPSASADPAASPSALLWEQLQGEDSGSGGLPGWVLPVGIGVGAAAVIAVAAVVVFRRRKGGPPSASQQGGIYMRLEVIAGRYAGRSQELSLYDELIIGRDKSCDLPWKEPALSPRSARIFQRDHVIYIEDLGTECGTALGGMRLHGPNRLRSGDEVSIGPVRFRLKF